MRWARGFGVMVKIFRSGEPKRNEKAVRFTRTTLTERLETQTVTTHFYFVACSQDTKPLPCWERLRCTLIYLPDLPPCPFTPKETLHPPTRKMPCTPLPDRPLVSLHMLCFGRMRTAKRTNHKKICNNQGLPRVSNTRSTKI